jgi:hypothetical protein
MSISQQTAYFSEFPTIGPATTVLGPEWEVYDSLGNAGFGVRSPGQIEVVAEPTSTSGGNVLQITADNIGGQHYSGGLKLRVPQLYGQYEFRVRVAKDPSEVTSGVVLLWPQSNEWPRDGELNWWETFDHRDTRQPTKSYIHRLNPAATPPFDASDDEIVVEVPHDVDQSDWHKVVGTWTPTAVTVEIDNGAAVLLTSNPAFIPGTPMELTFQLDAWSATPPATPVVMQVDYVLVRAWEPPPGPDPTLFPLGRLDATVEMAFAASGPSTGWTWADVTPRLLSQTIGIQRGRPDESGALQPSSISVMLDNRDGHLMPNNPVSPWWPHVRRGTPLRIRLGGDVPALDLDGAAGARASTPHDASLTATDLDLRMLILPDAWAPGPAFFANGAQILLGNTQRLATKWLTAGDQRGFVWHLWGDGHLSLEWTSNGATTAHIGNSRQHVSAVRPTWVAVTLDTAANIETHWRWDGPGDPPEDIGLWAQVDSIDLPDPTSLHASTAELALGGQAGLPSFRGRIYRAELRDGINGTVVANPDFTSQALGTTVFTDGAGREWTLHENARIGSRRIRFVGSVDSIEPEWPLGDNHPTTPDSHPSEHRVHVTASDIVRRLRQGGAVPLRSPLHRQVTSVIYGPSMLGYWPMEDPSGATHFASGLPSHPVATTTGFSAGGGQGLPGSASVAVLSAGDAGTITAAVPNQGPASTWAAEWAARIGAPTSAVQLIEVIDAGTLARWRVLAEPAGVIRVQIANAGGTQIATQTATIAVSNYGRWLWWRLDCQQVGGSVAWQLTMTDPTTGFELRPGISGTTTGTVARPTQIGVTTTGTPDGTGLGHLIVHRGTLPGGAAAGLSWLAGADTAWVGETAAKRIWRLCREEGVPVEIDQRLDTGLLRGDPTLSEPMGPQGQAPLLDLIGEAASLDMGALLSRRGAPGITYRPGLSLRGQPARLQLDGRSSQIGAIAAKLDDQRIANDVTVTSRGGSSARAVDTGSVATEGRYAVEIEVAGIGGVPVQPAILSGNAALTAAQLSQNATQASRRLELGTDANLRWPSVSVDLAVAPELIADVLALEVGDRATLTGLPVQHDGTTVQLLVEGMADRMTPVRWSVDLATSPGAPWVDPPPSPQVPTLGFRTQQALATPGQPPHVLTALGHTSTDKITRAELDGILDTWLAGSGGTLRTVTSAATWATAMAAAQPGDLIRVTSSFSTASQLQVRGSLYGLSGSTLTANPAGGTTSAPIVVTCANGVAVTGTSMTSDVPVLDLVNCRHVWAVGFNAGGPMQFGIRAMNWGGTSAAPAYIAYCTSPQVRDAAIACQGWFQAITASGGTPPAGAGNEWGFSEHFVVEENTVLDPNPGDVPGNPGEGIYLGRGAPGWVGYAKDCWVRGNRVLNYKANAYEAKPGCHRVWFTDNVAVAGRGSNGAAFELCYQFSGISPRPAWMNNLDGAGSPDVRIFVEANRVYDYNITETGGATRNQAFLLGMAGVRIANNMLWSARDSSYTGLTNLRAVLVQTEKTLSDFGPVASAPTWVVNNNWQSSGLSNPGAGGSPITGIIFRNNIVPTGYSDGTHTAGAADYQGATPAPGVLSDADLLGRGPGSAFDLRSDSTLVGTGASIADLDLAIDADLFGRPIPSSPNPGPFQPD